VYANDDPLRTVCQPLACAITYFSCDTLFLER